MGRHLERRVDHVIDASRFRVKHIAAIATALSAMPVSLAAQVLPVGLQVIEVEIRDRRLHGRENPAFRPFEERRRVIHVMAIDSTAAGRTLSVRLSPAIPSGSIAQDGAGRVLSISVAPPRDTAGTYPRRDSLLISLALWFEGDALSIPESRLWDIVPARVPPDVTIGGQWTDTLRFEASGGGNHQSLEGVRVSTWLGDTTIDGRRMVIVRDSAHVRYAETARVRERTLAGFTVETRELEGELHGRHLYDVETGFFAQRADTLLLEGNASLAYADGRRFETLARYERTRRLTLYDTEGWTARNAELRAQLDPPGGLRVPTDSIQARLRRGDAALRDSLVSEWHRARDPELRAELHGVLVRWARGLPSLSDLALEAGDTVFAYDDLLTRGDPRVDSARLTLLLPFVRDPGLAFAFGVDRDPPWENIRQVLLRSPPALGRDSAGWGCEPVACRTLAALADADVDPRARDLGLLTRFLLDPPSHVDSFRTRIEAGSVLLKPAASLLTPVPAADADWREWLEWMSPSPDPAAPAPARPPERIRFLSDHGSSIRFETILTGRDVVGEVRRRFETSQDSARLLFGTLLDGLGAMTTDPASLPARLLSSDLVTRRLALSEFRSWFYRDAAPADATSTAELIDRALAIMIERAAPWPDADGSITRPDWTLSYVSITGLPIFMDGADLPSELHEKWSARTTILTDAEWQARDQRQPAVFINALSVRSAGPFAAVGLQFQTRIARTPEQTPTGDAGAFTYYLLRTADGWIVVNLSMRR